MSARKGRRAAGALVALSLAAASPAAAQGVPVYDASSVAQAIQQVQQGVEMIARAQATIDAITGARGIGSVMNAPRDIAERASAQQLSGLVDGAITGSEVLGNTARLVQTIERLKGNLDLDDLGTYASSDLVQDRALSVLGGTSLAAMATGEDSYTRANEAMTRVNQLIPQIDANTDLKAAIDFNTRVNIEQNQLLAELIRLQAAEANASGAAGLFNARQEIASRKFMRIGDTAP